MREGAPSALYAGSLRWYPRVSAWLGGELLAADVPILGGTYNEDSTQDVPDSVTLQVPRRDSGTDWLPGDDAGHPLAAKGQYLIVSVIVETSRTGQYYETRLGRFRIQAGAHDDNGVITINGSGVLKDVQDDGLATPFGPRAGGTFVSELRRLVPAGIPVEFSADLVDRPMPQSIEFSDDRLAAISAIVKAWGARMFVDGYGVLRVEPDPPEVAEPILWYRDGEGGTIVRRPVEWTRDGIYNRVIVRASDTDGSGENPVLAIVSQEYGPYKADYDGFGIKTKIFSSPYVTTQAHAVSAGGKDLRDSLRLAQVVRCEIVSDPRVQNGDPVSTVRDGVERVGYVVAAQHPLTHKDGPSQIDVGVL